MKKSIWLGAMTAMMLFASSCQNDEYSEGMESQTSVVSFTLEQPSIASRGYSNGETVTTVYCAVYVTPKDYKDETPVEFKIKKTEPLTNGKATVDIKFSETGGEDALPYGTYDFVFWAEADDAPYTFDENKREVTVNNYETTAEDADKRDAFFAIRNGVAVDEKGVLESIILTRPFAQLNFGAIENMITTPKKSSVTVNKVYNTLDMKTGNVDGTATEQTFSMTDIPQNNGEDFPVDGVEQYLSMSYLLVPTDAGLIDVTFNLYEGTESTEPSSFNKIISNVPVQRNYRTNIYGEMNTPTPNEANFIVEVNKEFEKPDYNSIGVTDADGVHYKTIAEAIEAGVTEIHLGEASYVLPDEVKGKTLKFVGAGEKTVIHVEGNNDALIGSTVTFDNLTLRLSENDTYKGFQHITNPITYKNCIIEGQHFLYGESLFENCTFNNSGDNYNVWTYGATKTTFTNCTFNCDGKAVLIYTEDEIHAEHTFEGCVFNSSGKLDEKKAAIEIGSSPYSAETTYKVIVKYCQVNGFAENDKGIPTGTTIWGNKNSMDKDHLNVIIDRTEEY